MLTEVLKDIVVIALLNTTQIKNQTFKKRGCAYKAELNALHTAVFFIETPVETLFKAMSLYRIEIQCVVLIK